MPFRHSLYRFHSYLNRFESLESLKFSVFFLWRTRSQCDPLLAYLIRGKRMVKCTKQRVTRVTPVQTVTRNCTRDEGGPFAFGNQVLIASHRKLLRVNAVVVSVAETPGR